MARFNHSCIDGNCVRGFNHCEEGGRLAAQFNSLGSDNVLARAIARELYNLHLARG